LSNRSKYFIDFSMLTFPGICAIKCTRTVGRAMPFVALKSAYHLRWSSIIRKSNPFSKRETNPSRVKHCFRDIKWSLRRSKKKCINPWRNYATKFIAARFATRDLSVCGPLNSRTLILPPLVIAIFSSYNFSRMKRTLRAFAIMPRGRCEKLGEFPRRKGFH